MALYYVHIKQSISLESCSLLLQHMGTEMVFLTPNICKVKIMLKKITAHKALSTS